MMLISKVKVNSAMKQQAQEQFIRQSVKAAEQAHDKEIKNIIENVQSSMLNFKNVKASKTNKTKIALKQDQKVNSNKFDVYFKSYSQTLRFLKKSIKEFLSFYKNKHAGIISSYLLVLVLTLKKAYMIRALQSEEDIFELDIDMGKVSINKYVSYLKSEMRNEAKMIVQLRNIIENLSMPIKSYTTLPSQNKTSPSQTSTSCRPSPSTSSQPSSKTDRPTTSISSTPSNACISFSIRTMKQSFSSKTFLRRGMKVTLMRECCSFRTQFPIGNYDGSLYFIISLQSSYFITYYFIQIIEPSHYCPFLCILQECFSLSFVNKLYECQTMDFLF